MAFIPIYILILFTTILVDYISGILIDKSRGRRRAIILALSIVTNLGMLGFFKYFNFVASNIAQLFSFFGWSCPVHTLPIILPIGLSFHTFQSMGYTVEVYRGRKPEYHPGVFALYVMFYPQLVAGPIERPNNLLVQLKQPKDLDYQRIADGLKLMAWGFFKKLVIADRLAVIVDQVYGKPTNYQGVILASATICFAYQIYCDFSGYTDIAIGAARVMGFDLMKNFSQPYLSSSVSEFWKRWHISLSSWFRDYLYIPLGGNRVSKWRHRFNLILVFLLSGLWHGASWTFIIWGLIHGGYLILSIWTKGLRQKIVDITGVGNYPVFHNVLRISLTFLAVCFAWIFFRAPDISTAWYIVTHLWTGWYDLLVNLQAPAAIRNTFSSLNLPVLLPALVSIVILELAGYFHNTYSRQGGGAARILASRPVLIRWSAYYALFCWILLFGRFGTKQFIYFQF
jgi:D-alanyl-lipoteichoic acid acyltransferase DltB (MBOAT superfamily)